MRHPRTERRRQCHPWHTATRSAETYPGVPLALSQGMARLNRVPLIAFAIAFLGTPLGAQQQSLAEASEAAKKIKHEWPADAGVLVVMPRVITNKDLPAAGPAPASAAVTAAAEPVTTAGTGLTAAAVTDKGEAYWRARLAPLTAQLDTDRSALAATAVRYEELRQRYNGMRTVFQQQSVGAEMFRQQTAVGTGQALVDADLGAIEALREEGRKAGALPGWLR